MDLQTLLNKAQVKASELNPYLKDKCLELVELAYKNGYQIIITQGYRSIAEQDALYAQGRTKPGNIVTNAKGGSSNHNYRLAFDIAVLNSDGSIDWNTNSKYNAVGKLGQSLGLEWGGAWTSFVDLPHFEYVYGLSITQLKAGATIPNYPKGYNVIKEDSQVGIIKERVYAENGVLKFANGNYSISATDVRYIKFNKDSYKLKLVWAKGKTVSQLVKEHGADYGFNFPFFWDGNPVADCKIGSTILNQGYDTVGGAQQTKWHGFAYKNGQPMIGMFNVNNDFGSDGFYVATTPLLIENGNPCWDYYRVYDGTASDIGKNGNTYVRAQRTFAGLDPQGNLHLAVGDGRTSYDRGLNLEEMALYMASKGVTNALNGDGGGSSVIADKTGSLGQNQGAEERIVNHAVLVFLNPTTPTTPPEGGTTVDQWKLDTLQALSQYTQKDGSPFIDYDTWKTKLDETAPNWLLFELIKRILDKQS
jgi:hypothetical protein